MSRRRAGQGSIYQRGAIWWVRYYDINGKQQAESTRSTRRRDAETLLTLRLGSVQKGEPVSPKMNRITFDDAAADVVNDYKANGQRSRGHLERRLALHLRPFFGGRRLASISTATLREYIAHRQAQGASSASINLELSVVRRAFVLALQSGRVSVRPYIPMLKLQNARQGFFEREAFAAVCSHLPQEVRDVATFAYLSGWRKGEILQLQWKDVDLRAGTVRLDPAHSKTKDGRVLVLPVELRQLLERRAPLRIVNATIVPWVFHRDGQPIRTFQKSWETACRLAGQPGKIFHDLRRTAVRNFVRAGVSEHTAMQISGHKTRSIFDRYDIVDESDLRRAAELISQAKV